VHPHELAARKPHEHVRPQLAIAPGDRGLLEEVAVRHHPGHLDDVAQLDLAPGAARRRPPERGDEVAGLRAQGAHALAEVPEHLRELPLSLPALALETADLVLHAAELLLDRAHETLDLLAAQGHLAGRALALG